MMIHLSCNCWYDNPFVFLIYKNTSYVYFLSQLLLFLHRIVVDLALIEDLQYRFSLSVVPYSVFLASIQAMCFFFTSPYTLRAWFSFFFHWRPYILLCSLDPVLELNASCSSWRGISLFAYTLINAEFA
jgi:hypothetical protein